MAERAALLLAMKEDGKSVSMKHILDKVGRDVRFVEGRSVSQPEIEAAVLTLVEGSLAEKVKDGFRSLKSTDEFVEGVVESSGLELNRSYVLIWTAKQYYPKVARFILPFLQGRAVSAVKVFSGKKDPIRGLETIFVRYDKYKPKPVFITVDCEETLMNLVYDHCVDFIPYVHKLGAEEPDIFILDLDAGAKIMAQRLAFNYLRFVASELAHLLLELGVKPMVKFSGSRGFQIWVSFDNDMLRNGDVFSRYRGMAVETQRMLESRLQSRFQEVKSLFPEMVQEGRHITTSTVAHKEERSEQVLVDWSSMKLMGDVRAPFSIHHKTGLVSIPIPLEKLDRFKVSDAAPLTVVETVEEYASASRMKISDPTPLFPNGSR